MKTDSRSGVIVAVEGARKPVLLKAAKRTRNAFRKFKALRLAKSISEIEQLERLARGAGFGSFQEESGRMPNPVFFLDGEAFKGSPGKTMLHCDEYVRDADEITCHNFDLLGSGKMNLSEGTGGIPEAGRKSEDFQGICWHRDFKSGLEWEPDVFYMDTLITGGNGYDIKVPWELSRFQHIPTLGIAYWITGDERYAREFTGEIDDWIRSNPPLYGVNWTCPMDVAIRAVNWIWGYYFFRDSQMITHEFLTEFLESLYIHGRYIKANLERSPRLTPLASSLLNKKLSPSMLKAGWCRKNTNHYLSDLVGLIYIGAFFPESEECARWFEFARRELTREIKRQVYPDGVDYEGSISYHRLVTELFLSANLLCSNNGVAFPISYLERLEKMLEFIMYYTKPDGTAPQIGDNDDGRLHILARYGDWDRVDHRYLLSVGAALFNRADFERAAGECHQDAFWLLGEEGTMDFGKTEEHGSHLSSKAFPFGGFYIMRSDMLYMIVDCVPADPRAPSGHKHNSRLSFELFAYDKSFIVDPGSYIYTADKEMRNLFRSTRYHNTIVVDGDEQNRFDKDKLFEMGNDATIQVNRWEIGTQYDVLDVEHHGYMRLGNPVIHRRQILFSKIEGFWVIKDILSGEGAHQLDLYFHFAPIDVELSSRFPLAIETKTEGANLAIIPLETEGVSVEIEQAWVAYRYGVKERASMVRYSRMSEAPTSVCNVLYPYVGEIDMDEAAEKAAKKAEALK